MILAIPDHPRQQPPPPPTHVSHTGSAVYNLEDIVGWRERGGKAEFLVKWVNYTSDENTWEPHTNLTGYGSGTQDIFEKYVREADPRLRELLPMRYGGTGRYLG